MNDKFKLLALQAKMGTADFDVGSYYVATPDKMQRFAELIVRECAGLLDGEWEKEILCGSDAASILKQHFGVEQ